MLDAVFGSMIMVAATGALVLFLELSEAALSTKPRPCSPYEQSVVAAAAKGRSYAQAVEECSKVAEWLAQRRDVR